MNDKQPVKPIDSKQRIRILERDNYTCTCGFQGESGQGPHGIQVHHIVPRSAGGSNDDDNLRSQCGVCHTKEDRLLRKAANGKGRMPLQGRGKRKTQMTISVTQELKDRLAEIAKEISPQPTRPALIFGILSRWVDAYEPSGDYF